MISACLPTCLPACLPSYLPTYLAIYLSISLSIYQSIYLSVYLSKNHPKIYPGGTATKSPHQMVTHVLASVLCQHCQQFHKQHFIDSSKTCKHLPLLLKDNSRKYHMPQNDLSVLHLHIRSYPIQFLKVIKVLPAC